MALNLAEVSTDATLGASGFPMGVAPTPESRGGQMSGPRIEDELKQLVEKHTVCYDIFPDCLLIEGEIRKVGFELQLFGTHDHGNSRLTPGCELCVHTFADVRRIAEWVLPQERRDSKYEIQPFDSALHETPKRRLMPEVALSIMIEHRHDFYDPNNECETRCLHEMEKKLKELGVRRGN